MHFQRQTCVITFSLRTSKCTLIYLKNHGSGTSELFSLICPVRNERKSPNAKRKLPEHHSTARTSIRYEEYRYPSLTVCSTHSFYSCWNAYKEQPGKQKCINKHIKNLQRASTLKTSFCCQPYKPWMHRMLPQRLPWQSTGTLTAALAHRLTSAPLPLTRDKVLCPGLWSSTPPAADTPVL